MTTRPACDMSGMIDQQQHSSPPSQNVWTRREPHIVDSPPMLVSASSLSTLTNEEEREVKGDVDDDSTQSMLDRVDWPPPPVASVLGDSIDDSQFMDVPPLQENPCCAGTEDTLDTCKNGDHVASNARTTSRDSLLSNSSNMDAHVVSVLDDDDSQLTAAPIPIQENLSRPRRVGTEDDMLDTSAIGDHVASNAGANSDSLLSNSSNKDTPAVSVSDDKHSPAPMQEHLSRPRPTGTDDALGTCTIRYQQQRVEALRFLYKNLETRRDQTTVQNDQHNNNNSSNLKREYVNSNNPLIGSTPKFMKVEHVQHDQDWQLACKLQQDFFESSLDVDSSSMNSTIAGRAFQFVERVVIMHQDQLVAAASVAATANPQQQLHEQIELVAIDDMYFMAERMMQQQAEFRLLGKPVHVDIGFHYTHIQNMDNIRTNGLLSRAEQYVLGITARAKHGMMHGDGIYTGNYPHVFSHFGTVGILVARLKGQTCHSRLLDPNCDTVETEELSRQMVILQSSSQCIPLVHFPKSIVEPLLFSIARYHDALQNIIDEFFNNGRSPTVVPLAAAALQLSPTLKPAHIPTTVHPGVRLPRTRAAVPVPSPIPPPSQQSSQRQPKNTRQSGTTTGAKPPPPQPPQRQQGSE